MEADFFSTIKPVSHAEKLQIQAARQVLAEDFKGAIESMRQSLGLADGDMPRWTQAERMMQSWMTGQTKEIGNAFVYRRLVDEKHGQAACAVLAGDYGIVANLMYEYEWKQKYPINPDDYPTDPEEFLEFVNNDYNFCANDNV
jgi:hypothetical protein